MGHNQPHQGRRGPQIYVHVEFGVSWNSKAAKNHEITYRSRNMRERTPAFPRQVPAPNTNYLTAIHDYQQRRSWTQQLQQRQYQQQQTFHAPAHASTAPPPYTHHQMQEYYQVPRPHAQGHQRQQQAMGQDQGRQSRAGSRGSHERGHSAPPPIGENPWDVSIPQERAVREAVASRPPPPDQWKALPAPPSQFRLGDDGMPWSAWSWPMGYDPSAYPQDEDPSTTTRSRERPRRERLDSVTYATSPTMVSTFSPGPSNSTRTRRRDDTDPGRVQDLEALSAAMMTVDNGFENQWWNQGMRQSYVPDANELSPAPALPAPVPVPVPVPAAHHPQSSRFSTTSSVGWAVAEDTPTRGRDEERSLFTAASSASVVSPMTDSAVSPPQVYQQPLQRSMSTRSEELWFTEPGGGSRQTTGDDEHIF